MKRVRHVVMTGLLTLGLVAVAAPARAELLEEIIAWVNGDIITWSEYQGEEKARTAEAYQQFTGEELDRVLEMARSELLLSMIDRKILLHHAQALGYDMERMSDAYAKSFMQQQEIANEDEDSAVAVWQLRYRQDLLGDDLNVFHNHEIISNISGRTNTFVKTSTGVSYEITDLIYTSMSVDFDYETEPAAGTDKEDLALLLGIGVEFD